MGYSLSYIKKRVAAYNKELGTKISPKAVYEAQNRAESFAQYGRGAFPLSPQYRAILDSPDPRAAHGVPEENIVAYVGAQWGGFIRQNRRAQTVYNAFRVGSYVSGGYLYVPSGEIYLRYPMKTMQNAATVKTLPRNARRFTGADAERLLVNIATEIHKRQRANPTIGSDD